LHSDLNGFYASVECFHQPGIRDKPVVVGGDAEKRHGIILAKNEIAKKYGIKTGEAIWQAMQKCPDLVCIKPNFKKYLEYSGLVRTIYEQYTDRVEAFGLDECWRATRS
jgi:DNA polymerase-4